MRTNIFDIRLTGSKTRTTVFNFTVDTISQIIVTPRSVDVVVKIPTLVSSYC